jgi:hypothetical protein
MSEKKDLTKTDAIEHVDVEEVLHIMSPKEILPGWFFFVDSEDDALKIRGPSGTITTIALH